MKSSKELQSMLLSEICNNLIAIEKERELDCYNQILGDTSFLLSGILENELDSITSWNPLNWIDDSLIHKVKIDEYKVRLWGVMIWGKNGTTKQWTDPFYSEFLIDCEDTTLQKLTILFGDEMLEEVTYEMFSKNRSYWDGDYYSNSQWDPSERNWKYFVYL